MADIWAAKHTTLACFHCHKFKEKTMKKKFINKSYSYIVLGTVQLCCVSQIRYKYTYYVMHRNCTLISVDEY